MKRGDIVIAPFPFQDKPGFKVRPGVVVQNDADNQSIENTILAMVTGNLNDMAVATNLLVDPALHAGTGLSGKSLVKCTNLTSLRQKRVLRVLGRLPDELQVKLDECLKAALGL